MQRRNADLDLPSSSMASQLDKPKEKHSITCEKKVRRSSVEPKSQESKKLPKQHAKKRVHINPYNHPTKKPTALELFGAESEEEDCQVRSDDKNGNYSYFMRRLSSGYARYKQKHYGSHLVVLRIYDSNFLYSQYLIENRTNDNTGAWEYLSQFVEETRKNFLNEDTNN